jgi:hypothetical protein
LLELQPKSASEIPNVITAAAIETDFLKFAESILFSLAWVRLLRIV